MRFFTTKVLSFSLTDDIYIGVGNTFFSSPNFTEHNLVCYEFTLISAFKMSWKIHTSAMLNA